MVLEKSERTEEEVMSVRDRPLTESYEVHDIGQDLLVSRLRAHGFHVEFHGDDARHADEVFYGDGPDLAVYRHYDEHEQEPADLLAYIEIKCKESGSWFGRVNLRHFREYVNFNNETDVPVFIWFALVSDSDMELPFPLDEAEEGKAVCREAFIRVTDTDQIEGDIIDVSEEGIVFYEEDLQYLDDDLVTVSASDVIGVRSRDTVVEYIPDVHGNEVIGLNDDQFRSWPYFLHVLSQ